jgi:hypothetical protein
MWASEAMAVSSAIFIMYFLSAGFLGAFFFSVFKVNGGWSNFVAN